MLARLVREFLNYTVYNLLWELWRGVVWGRTVGLMKMQTASHGMIDVRRGAQMLNMVRWDLLTWDGWVGPPKSSCVWDTETWFFQDGPLGYFTPPHQVRLRSNYTSLPKHVLGDGMVLVILAVRKTTTAAGCGF